MTPAQWRKLARAVDAFDLRCEVPPSPEARLVLRSLLHTLGEEKSPPAQEEWSRRLGLSERVLRARLDELEGSPVCFVLRARRGSAPAVYEVIAERVQRWVAGELEFVVQESPHYRDEKRTTNEPLWDGNRPTASRGRVTPPPQLPLPPRQEPTPTQLSDAVSTIRHLMQIRFPNGVHPRLFDYMARGITQEDIVELSLLGAGKGVNAPNWLFLRFDERLRQREEEAGVIRLDDDEQEPGNVRPFTGAQ